MNNKGFTLVEISVVVIIIGLIISGIVQGQYLYRGSKIRTIVTSVNEYKAATSTFYNKYKCLPGDFNDVTSVSWSSSANGDCDGAVESGSESQHVWEHLRQSQILAVDYVSQFAKGKVVDYALEYSQPDDFGYDANSGEEKNRFYPELFTRLLASEAYSLDKKYDDGYPGLGDIIAGNAGTSSANDCTGVTGTASDTNIDTAGYDRDGLTKKCGLIFSVDY